ncbi:MAG: SpoIIE family protein phosphatase [Pirellulaceae bacterium]
MTQFQLLLIEDTADDVALLQARLRSDARFEITAVDSLHRAFSANSNGCKYDVIILDLSLPDSCGLDTLTKVQSHFHETPVVILTGLQDEGTAIEALRLGAHEYLTKNEVDTRAIVRGLLYAIERNERRRVECRARDYEQVLETAWQIQRTMLPKSCPVIPGLEIAAAYRPAEVCSGDYYDFIQTPLGHPDARHWNFAIADVAGHGLGPALIMVGTRRILRTCTAISTDVGHLLELANDAVCEDVDSSHFVTAFCAQYDPSQRSIVYSGAGHGAWMFRAGQSPVSWETAGVPLGLVPGFGYPKGGPVRLETGDVVLMMTDGAYEAMSPSQDEFGLNAVFESVQSDLTRPAQQIVNDLLDRILSHCAPNEPKDDITVVLLKVV